MEIIIMQKNTTFKEITGKENLVNAFSILKQLRNNLDIDSYLELLDQMIQEGYKMFGLFCDGNLVAVAGLSILTNFYYGRHVWIYDLITDNNFRSKGYGHILLSEVEKWSLAQDCKVIALSSGVSRTNAHHFYEKKCRFSKVSYVFKRTI